MYVIFEVVWRCVGGSSPTRGSLLPFARSSFSAVICVVTVDCTDTTLLHEGAVAFSISEKIYVTVDTNCISSRSCWGQRTFLLAVLLLTKRRQASSTSIVILRLRWTIAIRLPTFTFSLSRSRFDPRRLPFSAILIDGIKNILHVYFCNCKIIF